MRVRDSVVDSVLDPSPTGQRSWRYRGGALLCLAVTLLATGVFCERDCLADEAYRLMLLVLISAVDAWLLIALVSGRGRRVALGFVSMMIIVALPGRGWAQIWTLPARVAISALRPLWGPVAEAGRVSSARSAWAGARRAELPTVVHAQRLANAVHECAARHRALDSLASFPRDGAQIPVGPECGGLAVTRSGAAPDPQLYTEADYGWRWSYTPGPADATGRVSSYALRVFEDPAVGRTSPQYEGDESGIVRELATGKPAAIVASPVAGLVQLRACLARVPAQHLKDEATYGHPRPHRPLDEVEAVCPELRGHYRGDYEDREKGWLALSARGTPGEFIDSVAVYSIELVPADEAGLIFELRASPIRGRNPFVRSGVRRFFVARDGSVHVTTGQGAAGEGDPLVEECTGPAAVGCGDVPVAPRQLPAS